MSVIQHMSLGMEHTGTASIYAIIFFFVFSLVGLKGGSKGYNRAWKSFDYYVLGWYCHGIVQC